jgi:hypothetical protein
MLSTTDGWAVGFRDGLEVNRTIGFALRWSGTSWHEIAVPAFPGKDVELYQVAVRAANDAWAVGTVIDPDSGHSIALVLHWNGSSWSQLIIIAQTINETLFAVVSTSPGVALAVGATTDRPFMVQLSLQAGSSVALPSSVASQTASLRAITMIAPNDIWAVGGTVIVHWDGTQRSQVVAPTLNPSDNLHALGALGSNAVWAAGENSSGSIILRWNGAGWQQSPGPVPEAGIFYVTDVVPVTLDDIWIVGYTSLHGYVFHYDGTGWLESVAALPHGEVLVAGRLPLAYDSSSIFRIQPSVGFASATPIGTPANGTIAVPVLLSSTVPQTVTVGYTVAGGSATPGSDYVPATGVISIPPCTRTQAIAVTIQSGADWSTLKTIGLTLRDVQGSTFGTASTVAPIRALCLT